MAEEKKSEEKKSEEKKSKEKKSLDPKAGLTKLGIYLGAILLALYLLGIFFNWAGSLLIDINDAVSNLARTLVGSLKSFGSLIMIITFLIFMFIYAFKWIRNGIKAALKDDPPTP